MKRTKLLFAVVLLYNMFFSACWKELDSSDCNSADCVKIKLAGHVYTQDSVGVSDIQINVWWKKRGDTFPTYKITSGKSEKDGSFNMHTTIDTTFFIDYKLSVNVALGEKDSSYFSDNVSTEFDRFDIVTFQTIEFTLFKLK
jgi:hypothetical protein